MPEQKYSVERDLKEAKEMADALDTYVRGDELYGRIGGVFGGGAMPSTTVGALLMRLRRLRALENRLSPAQRAELDQIEARHDAVRNEWQLHYSEKLNREANSRLDAMNHFFEECNNSPGLCAGNYLPEALRRTIVQEIARSMEGGGTASGDLTAKMRQVDSKLRRFAQPSDFIWDPALRDAYPQNPYWWLYARPPRPEKK